MIIIHELGHTIVVYLFKGKIEYIYIYPLGGISKFQIELNTSIWKEFWILIAGPLFQFLAYLFLLKIFPDKERMVRAYHYSILWFNLLPIYPLDGGKIMNLFLEVFFPFKKSKWLILYSSYLWVFGIFFSYQPLTINLIIMTILLLTLITKEKKKVEYTYQKFLLERYLKEYSFKRSKIIKNENNFYRGRKHILKLGETYYLEREYLQKKYKKIGKSY